MNRIWKIPIQPDWMGSFNVINDRGYIKLIGVRYGIPYTVTLVVYRRRVEKAKPEIMDITDTYVIVDLNTPSGCGCI